MTKISQGLSGKGHTCGGISVIFADEGNLGLFRLFFRASISPLFEAEVKDLPTILRSDCFGSSRAGRRGTRALTIPVERHFGIETFVAAR